MGRFAPDRVRPYHRENELSTILLLIIERLMLQTINLMVIYCYLFNIVVIG